MIGVFCYLGQQMIAEKVARPISIEFNDATRRQNMHTKYFSK